jgi:xylulokinase
VALNTRWMLRPVEKFLGRKLAALTLAGGGGASDVWCQIFADTLGLRIRQLESPVQANALGAASIAGVGLGLMTFEDAARSVRYRREYEPDAHNVAIYNECFARFREVHARLAPLYRKWNAAGGRAPEKQHGRL